VDPPSDQPQIDVKVRIFGTYIRVSGLLWLGNDQGKILTDKLIVLNEK
jgi:hypothetical protein